MKKEKQKNYKGFTLLEMLVVVLIIGILAGIALPQYQMAVTKAKVATMLPLMRRWYDAMQEYKLQHGNYCSDERDGTCYEVPDGSDLGVNWPSDWDNGRCGDDFDCSNDYWECFANEEGTGYVYCFHYETPRFVIMMYQHDDYLYEELQGKMTCEAMDTKSEKICKALGGKFLEGVRGAWGVSKVYKLN